MMSDAQFMHSLNEQSSRVMPSMLNTADGVRFNVNPDNYLFSQSQALLNQVGRGVANPSMNGVMLSNDGMMSPRHTAMNAINYSAL